MTTLTRQEVTTIIRAAVEAAGGPVPFARGLDVTPSYISHTLSGKKPGKRLLARVGIVEVRDTYVRVKG